jgi:hypothetical protein
LPNNIDVTIVFNSKTGRCEAACGPDWSSLTIVEPVKRQIRERFGGIANLELIDLSVVSDKRVSLLQRRITKEKLPLPLLLVDGEVRIAGEFDARQLMDAVEVQKELRWKTNTT